MPNTKPAAVDIGATPHTQSTKPTKHETHKAQTTQGTHTKHTQNTHIQQTQSTHKAHTKHTQSTHKAHKAHKAHTHAHTHAHAQQCRSAPHIQQRNCHYQPYYAGAVFPLCRLHVQFKVPRYYGRIHPGRWPSCRAPATRPARYRNREPWRAARSCRRTSGQKGLLARTAECSSADRPP